MKLKHALLITLIIAMAMLRLGLGNIANFAPIAGIGIFAMYYFKNKWLGFIIALSALFFSDVVINLKEGYEFYWGRGVDYLGFAAGIGLAYFVFKRKRNFLTAIGSAIGASLLFYLVSNFGVWAGSTYYPQTWEGIINCYHLAIPFFRNTLTGDVLFTGAFIGVYELAKVFYPQLESNAS